MKAVGESTLWVEKYRPQTVEDIIAPADTTKLLKKIVSSGEMPNLLLYGSAGIGKTTTAKAIGKDLGMDVKYINGSLETSIDNIRNEVRTFATTCSLVDKPKLIILDEADRISAQGQDALKVVLEETADIARFVFCTNNMQKIIAPLHSRCSLISFNYGQKHTKDIMIQYFKRVKYILDSEEVEYSEKLLAGFIQNLYPDFRKIINELQKYVKMHGKIDEGILAATDDSYFTELMDLVKAKKFEKMRNYCSNVDADNFWTTFYTEMKHYFRETYLPQLILVANEFQMNHPFAPNKELNVAAFCTELMMKAQWK